MTMNEPAAQDSSTGDSTRQSLIESGLRLFGLKGFDGASIRDIAGAARTNIASIGYHFGGKEGLRRACAEHVAATIRSLASAALSQDMGSETELGPVAARERLHAFVDRVVPFILTDARARLMMHFMLREMASPSIAFDIVYGGVVEPTHRRLCRLWARVTGEEPESTAVRLAVFSIIGQIFYFRFGQEIILRRMAWKEYDATHADAINREIIAGLDAALDRHAARKFSGGEP